MIGGTVTVPPLHWLAVVAPVLYWAGVIVAVMASVCCIALTLRRPRRWLVIVAASGLAVAFFMVAIPHPPPDSVATALIGIAVFALSAAGGGPAVQFVLALADRGGVEGTNGGIVVTDAKGASTDSPKEVLRGGRTIGIFERVATTGAIMAGYPEAVALVVAIKGVGRFTELDAAEARERFIIGTLVSLVWAAACAGVFRLAAGA
jgi:hypothetical protein